MNSKLLLNSDAEPHPGMDAASMTRMMLVKGAVTNPAGEALGFSPSLRAVRSV
jgi:hypothetical protein